MIKQVHLKTYNSFEDCKIGLKPFTILRGFNGAGKSSIAKSPFFMKQVSEDCPDNVSLQGKYIQVGAVGDIILKPIFNHPTFGFTFKLGKCQSLCRLVNILGYTDKDIKSCDIYVILELEPLSGGIDLPVARIKKQQIGIAFYGKGVYRYQFETEFISEQRTWWVFNIGGFRIGVTDTDAGEDIYKAKVVYGIVQDLFSCVELCSVDYSPCNVKKLLSDHPNRMTINSKGVNVLLKDALADWARIVGLGNVSFEDNELYVNGCALHKCGIGINRAISIITGAINHINSGVLILEQPETGLGLELQIGLTEVLLHAMSCGKQIVIDTNSDAFVTRVVRRVLEHKVGKDSVGICWVYKDEYGLSKVIPIEIDDIHGINKFEANHSYGIFEGYLSDCRAILHAGYTNLMRNKTERKGTG